MSQRHHWRAKLVKGGPFIPVLTWFGPPLLDGEELDRSPRWQAKVRGETTGRAILMGSEVPIEVDGINLRNLERITEADYKFLVAHAAYATAHRPDLPDASPQRAIDWNKLKPIW